MNRYFDMKKLIPLVLFIFPVFILVTSCVPEYQLARQFVDNRPEADILIIPPAQLLKTNLNADLLENDTLLAEFEKDSILFARSIFLKNISDSIFFERYINNLILELDRLGFRTYLNSFPQDMAYDTNFNSFVFNLAQIELEEKVDTYRDTEQYNGLTYYKDLTLNSLTLHVWYELSRQNASDIKILYDSQTAMDQSYGYFEQNIFTGEVSYTENIAKLSLEDIYDFASVMAHQHAQYLFDFFLNNHIRRNFPDNKKRRFLLHYEPSNDSFWSVEDEGFKLIEE